MKARYIRRLRKEVSKFEEYIVIPCIGMFGEFSLFAEERTNRHHFMAENPVRAIRKYLRCYFRKNKEHHTTLRSVRHPELGVSSRSLI